MPKKKVDSVQDLISQAEAARLRGVSRASINELLKRGRLSSIVIAGRVFVRSSEILNFRDSKPGPKSKKR
jgi:hypothetical protein